MRLIFDIETNGFLDEVSRLHCLVIQNADTGEVFSCVTDWEERTNPYYSVPYGLDMLICADEVIGHNIIKYDIPVLEKLFPGFKITGKVTDTLVCTRLIWSDIAESDLGRVKKGTLPSKRIGSHALEAWGYRLGEMKGEYDGGWDHCSEEMISYCEQDVRVTKALYDRIVSKNYSAEALKLEHEFATIIAMQERHGFGFDVQAAHSLYQTLVRRRLELGEELKRTFPPKEVTEVFIPKVNNRKSGYVKGVPFTKRWMVEFNPSSRQMIADRLIGLGWKPMQTTPSGQPKVDESILEKLPYPEAKLLAEHFLVEKRIGQLAEGDQAWLRLERRGRIHGSVNTNGAVTGRCTHSQPNIAQVPRVGSPFGAECRGLFGVGPGRVLVGADLSGLELRCLAHFMAHYDAGEYGRVLLEGDIHTVNQLAAGLPTRNDAKTFIYAFLYGAGDQKIGSIVLPQGDEDEQRAIGKKLKRSFLKKTPALKALRDAVTAAAEKGWIKGLDGRILRIRSPHAALNTLLQSAGALIAKQATIFAYQDLSDLGMVWGKDWALVAHVHDEMQAEALAKNGDLVGKTLVAAMGKAGEHFKFRIPITGEYKIGTNWKETH